MRVVIKISEETQSAKVAWLLEKLKDITDQIDGIEISIERVITA